MTKHRRRRWLGGSLLLLLLLGGGLGRGVQAQDPTPTPTVWELEEKAQALLVEAMQLHQRGDYQGALAAGREALAICRQTGNQHNEATALQIMGEACLALSSYEQALTHYQEALAVVREIDHRWGEARMLHGIGMVYDSLSNYEQALAYYERSLAIDREIDEREGEAITLSSMGTVYFKLGDYEQALAYYQQSLSIENPSGIEMRRAAVLGSMGNVYEALGDYEQALDYYEQALDLFEVWGDVRGRASTLGNIANIYLDQDEYEQALASYRQVLSLQEEMGDRARAAASRSNIGLVYAARGDHEQALHYYEQALSDQRAIGDRAGEAYTLNNIGEAYKALGDYDQALQYYQQALRIMREIGDRVGEATTLQNIGELYELQGEDGDALQSYLQSISTREEIRAEVKVEAYQKALAGQDVPVYRRATRLLVALDRPEEAFNLAERNRARAFLNGLGNGQIQARQGAAADLLRQEEELRSELATLESDLLEEKSRPPDRQNDQVIGSIESQLAGKQQAYEDLLARLQLNNPELATLVTISTTTVTEVQSYLDGQTTLVVYYLTDETSLAFIVSAETFQTVPLPGTPEEIAQAVERFRGVGLANLEDTHPRSLGDLYDWLVAPLLPRLNSPVVGIVPYQVLHYVPFAALHDGERYFGQQFTLFSLPSASVLPFIWDKAGREVDAPLILGDPETAHPQMPRLPFAEQEARRVAQLLATQPLTGTQASEGTLRSRVAQAGIVHLAVHGSLNPVAPLFSRLWLAPGEGEDGRLNVHEVYGLELGRAGLVVLSACQTQLGELSAGDEVVGLNRAFLYGAPTVVASLWRVDDAATGALMTRFYAHLQEGMGKAEALQAAQAEVRRDPDYPQWSHPYYWAGFVLSGDPGQVTAEPPSPAPSTAGGGDIWVWAGITLAAVLGVGALLLLLQRRR